MASTTKAAERFMSGILVAWDHRDCYAQTAAKGLSETDADMLRVYCDETGDDYAEAEAEVMAFVRAKLS